MNAFLFSSTLVWVVCLALVVENTFTAHEEPVTRLRHLSVVVVVVVNFLWVLLRLCVCVCVCMEARPSKFRGLACVVASVELCPRLVLLRSSLQQDHCSHEANS